MGGTRLSSWPVRYRHVARMTYRRIAIAALVAAGAVVPIVGMGSPVHAAAPYTGVELSDTDYGMSCLAAINDPSEGVNFNMVTDVKFELRCNYHPGPGDTAKMTVLANAIAAGGNYMPGTSSQSYIYFGSSSSQGCNKASNYGAKVIAAGTIKDYDGNVLQGAMTEALKANQVTFELQCSDSGGWPAMTPHLIRLDNRIALTNRGENNPCGRTPAHMTASVSWYVCWDMLSVDYSASAPDYWGDQSPLPDACAGVTFSIRHEGTVLTQPLTGQLGSRGDSVKVRVHLPASSASQQIEVYFYPAFYSSSLLLLRDEPIPSSRGILQWDVTDAFNSLDNDPYDFGEARIRCSSEYGVLYWDASSASTSAGSVTPLPDVVHAEGSCYSLDGMTLTNPVSWVTGAGRMGVCLVEWLFVPDDPGEWVNAEITRMSTEVPFSFVAMGVETMDSLTSPSAPPGSTACLGSFQMPEQAAQDLCLDLSIGASLIGGTFVESLLWFGLVGLSVLLFALSTIRMLF